MHWRRRAYVAIAVVFGACVGWVARGALPPDAAQLGETAAAAASGHAGATTVTEPAEPPPVLVTLLEEQPELLSRPLEADVLAGGSVWVDGAPIRVDRATFTSHTHRDGPVRIFGYYARPQAASRERAPGLVIIHGGGGRATRERAARGAANGFVSLAIDLPGQGPGRSRCRSTGPDMTVENLFATTPELSDNYLYHAALATLRSVEFLRQQPRVDADRIGLYGISWGGATSLIAGGLDGRLAGVVDLFGSGHVPGGSIWDGHLGSLDADSVATWEAEFDPARYAHRIEAPLLMVTGTNDGCYSLPRFLRTRETGGDRAHLLLRPNLNHKVDEAGDATIWAWLRTVVRDGVPAADLPRFAAVRVERGAEGRSARVSLAVGGTSQAMGGSLAYSGGASGWAGKTWSEVQLHEERPGWLVAEIPLDYVRTYMFGAVRCANGLRVSTPVHTFAGATVNDERRVYHVPYVPPESLELPLRELAGHLGLDADEVGARGLRLLEGTRDSGRTQPRARLVAGRLYVAHAEVERLTEASAAWLWDGPTYRAGEAH